MGLTASVRLCREVQRMARPVILSTGPWSDRPLGSSFMLTAPSSRYSVAQPYP